MNFIKSAFIGVFIALLLAEAMFAILQAVAGVTPIMAWLGLAMTSAPLLAFFLIAYLSPRPRGERHPVGYSVLAGLGLALTMAASYRYGEASESLAIWSGLTMVAWMIYLRWYSVLDARAAPNLVPGTPLPAFNLQTLDGQTVSSERFASSPHLLVFYRGNWCPFCTAQVHELAESCRELQAMGVTVALISSQPTKRSKALADRFDAPLVFFVDHEGIAAKCLGIQQPWGTPVGLQLIGYPRDTVLPTIILTDAEGKIVLADQTDNDRFRPEPVALCQALGDTQQHE